MAVDLKHLSATTREKVNRVVDAFADAEKAQGDLLAEGIRVVIMLPDHRLLRVELLDPQAEPDALLGDGHDFGIDVGPDDT